MLKCGFFEHDITPPLGAQMPGYFDVRLATGIKEPLKAIAAVFSDEEGVKSVIVACDAIQVPPQVNLAAREKIAEMLGCCVDCVTVHATHVHTGGPVLAFVCTEDEEYNKFLGQRIVDCAVFAAARQVEVKLGFAHAFDDTIANYRDRVLPNGQLKTNAGGETRPYGKIDPEISILFIDSPCGRHLGAVVNYACHTDCVGGTEFSSDFPGALRDTLRSVWGDGFTTVFLNGFFGNLNHITFHDRSISSRPKYYRSMGRKLAGHVIAAAEDAKWMEDPKITAASETIIARTRKPDAELLAWADTILADPENAKKDDLHFAKQARAVEARGQIDFPLCLQFVRFGDVNLFATPREMFVEFEHMIKEGSDSKWNIVTCNSNGGCGYVPTRELHAPGIYEARLNTGKLEIDTGYTMVDTLMKLMKNN